MKPRGMIGPPVLVIVICLGLAVFAIARRHRTELRLAELAESEAALQSKAQQAKTAAMLTQFYASRAPH
jgi:hypothetical protein